MMLNRNSKMAWYLVSIALILGLSASSSAVLADLRPLPTRPPAPELKLKDTNGKTIDLAKLHGEVVMITFWATWCPPCRAEMPSMQRAWEKLQDDNFNLLAVSVKEDKFTIAQFLYSIKPTPTFPILLDQQSKTTKFWPISKGLPSTFLIDKFGRVAYIVHGARDWNNRDIIARIQDLIDEPTSPSELFKGLTLN